jgi:hypothetical protein
MVILSLKNLIKNLLLFSFLLGSYSTMAQSCVCYKKDMLNDFKETDFIATIRVIDKAISSDNPDVDIIKFMVLENFKGSSNGELRIFQKTGFGKNNSNCKFFVKPGDEVLVFAREREDYLYTIPCYRNKRLDNDQPRFQRELNNDLSILRQLKPYTSIIDSNTTSCRAVLSDGQNRLEIERLRLPDSIGNARLALYNVKFDEQDRIQRIGVVAPFHEEIDKAIRIKLIKKRWLPCSMENNTDLILGYFYVPETPYRKAHLSPL